MISWEKIFELANEDIHDTGEFLTKLGTHLLAELSGVQDKRQCHVVMVGVVSGCELWSQLVDHLSTEFVLGIRRVSVVLLATKIG